MSLARFGISVISVLYVIAFVFLAFLPRSDFYVLVVVFAGIFALYARGLHQWKVPAIGWIIAMFLAVRLPFFFHLPQLSDDYFRFLWDGLLMVHGQNPFGLVPSAADLGLFTDPTYAANLLEGMNSPNYPSVYPPIHQLFSGVAVSLSGNGVLAGVNWMRTLILLCELMMLGYFIKTKGISGKILAAYLLNPLVVAEGVGNVHFEAALLPFLAIAVHQFARGYFIKSGLAWAGSILIKLTPLFLAPLFLFKNRNRKLWIFFGVTLVLVAGVFALISPWVILDGLSGGVGLYFKSFEFNASVYYLLSVILKWIVGYNVIHVLGPLMGMITLAVILFISWKGRYAALSEAALLIYIAYFLLATTVHPWYLIPVVYFALASHRYLLLIWSFSVWFSYSHYIDPLGPKWIWILAEYGLLIIAFFVESRRRTWFQPAETFAFRG